MPFWVTTNERRTGPNVAVNVCWMFGKIDITTKLLGTVILYANICDDDQI